MVAAGHLLTQMAHLALTAAILLLPVHLFLRCRLRLAVARGQAQRYVTARDPWIPVVVAASGAALLALLRLVT